VRSTGSRTRSGSSGAWADKLLGHLKPHESCSTMLLLVLSLDAVLGPHECEGARPRAERGLEGLPCGSAAHVQDCAIAMQAAGDAGARVGC
jgi:hypothetical protein